VWAGSLFGEEKRRSSTGRGLEGTATPPPTPLLARAQGGQGRQHVRAVGGGAGGGGADGVALRRHPAGRCGAVDCSLNSTKDGRPFNLPSLLLSGQLNNGGLGVRSWCKMVDKITRHVLRHLLAGMYDGTLGVIGAIEAIAALRRSVGVGLSPRRGCRLGWLA